MARQQPCDLRDRERYRAERAPEALRGVHQFQEHGALRLDRGADADDLGGVPARWRCIICGRRVEGGVRPARRCLDEWQIHPVYPRRHRWRAGTPHGADRLSRGRGPRAQIGPNGTGDEPRHAQGPRLPRLRQLRHAHDRGLHDLRKLRSQQMFWLRTLGSVLLNGYNVAESPQVLDLRAFSLTNPCAGASLLSPLPDVVSMKTLEVVIEVV